MERFVERLPRRSCARHDSDVDSFAPLPRIHRPGDDLVRGAPEAGDVRYRFRVRPPGGSFQMIRDYGPSSTLDWTASEQEGTL